MGRVRYGAGASRVGVSAIRVALTRYIRVLRQPTADEVSPAVPVVHLVDCCWLLVRTVVRNVPVFFSSPLGLKFTRKRRGRARLETKRNAQT